MFNLTPLGSVQTQAPGIKSVKGTSVDGTALYTCPAGKRATVNGSFLLRAYGAGGRINIAVGGINVLNWEVASEPIPPNRSKNFATDQVLNAGDAITKVQDVNNNATLDFVLNVTEISL